MSEILGTAGIQGGEMGNDTNKPSDAPATSKAAKDHAVNEPDVGGETSQDAGGDETTSDGSDQESGWDTGVNGIKANGEKGGLPVFDVTPQEFYNNMKLDRRKLVFKRGTPAQQYHASTNYHQPFYIRNTKDGYMKKVSSGWK
jgi:hypothetical protein